MLRDQTLKGEDPVAEKVWAQSYSCDCCGQICSRRCFGGCFLMIVLMALFDIFGSFP